VSVETARPTAAAVVEGAVSPSEPALSFADRVRSREGNVDLLVFRAGSELFATVLTAVEEALELPQLSAIPEMTRSMLGVVTLRGRMLPTYSPARPLGITLERHDAAALVIRAGERRIALAVDDVDDVFTLDLATLRAAPTAGSERDSLVVGVARRGGDLIAVLDAESLVSACINDMAQEAA
jgi:purine-binding chemotaxis protein CheW